MQQAGILRDLINISGISRFSDKNAFPKFVSYTIISHAKDELEVGDKLIIGKHECKVIDLAKYTREYACLTGEPVPGGRQFEIATDLNPDLARDLIGEDVYLVGQPNE